jgi:hypothetical protein
LFKLHGISGNATFVGETQGWINVELLGKFGRSFASTDTDEIEFFVLGCWKDSVSQLRSMLPA